jgi:hypothetical protein
MIMDLALSNEDWEIVGVAAAVATAIATAVAVALSLFWRLVDR